jgi:RNA polymerase sigma-70 factor (ECF subfamily)
MLFTEETIADEALTIKAAASGDREAFEELYRHYRPMIFAYSYRLCLNVTDAQDVAQETFIKVARALSSYEPSTPFPHWLYRVCTNTARDLFRQSARRERLHTALQEAVDGSGGGTRGAEATKEALIHLNDDLRQAVVLVFYEGLNHAEAAEILGCAESTVSWRIYRAERKLKILLQDHD